MCLGAIYGVRQRCGERAPYMAPSAKVLSNINGQPRCAPHDTSSEAQRGRPKEYGVCGGSRISPISDPGVGASGYWRGHMGWGPFGRCRSNFCTTPTLAPPMTLHAPTRPCPAPSPAPAPPPCRRSPAACTAPAFGPKKKAKKSKKKNPQKKAPQPHPGGGVRPCAPVVSVDLRCPYTGPCC